MVFIGYLILGGVVYITGFKIQQKYLLPKRKAGLKIGLNHPTMLGLLAGCFVVMLIVSMIIGRTLMGHQNIDVAYVVVNSLVATFIFYFSLNPDTTQMNLPD